MPDECCASTRPQPCGHRSIGRIKLHARWRIDVVVELDVLGPQRLPRHQACSECLASHDDVPHTVKAREPAKRFPRVGNMTKNREKSVIYPTLGAKPP